MKLYIIGIVAGGKTTLAKIISEKLNIPCYELDCIAHDESKTPRRKRTPDEQLALIREIDARGDFIFEGVYRESYHELLDIADTVLFLDPPLHIRRYRILKRFIKQRLGLENCHYKPTFHMLGCMFKWTRNFEKNRDKFEKMLHAYHEKLIVAGCARDAEREIYARLEAGRACGGQQPTII